MDVNGTKTQIFLNGKHQFYNTTLLFAIRYADFSLSIDTEKQPRRKNSNDSELKFAYDGLYVDFPRARRTRRESLVITQTTPPNYSLSCPNLHKNNKTNAKKGHNNNTYGLYVPFPKSTPLKRRMKREYTDRFGSRNESWSDLSKLEEEEEEEGKGGNIEKEKQNNNNNEFLLHSHSHHQEGEDGTCQKSNGDFAKMEFIGRKSFGKRLSKTFSEFQGFDQMIYYRKSFSGFRSCTKRASKVMRAVDTTALSEDEIIEKFTKSIFSLDLTKK